MAAHPPSSSASASTSASTSTSSPAATPAPAPQHKNFASFHLSPSLLRALSHLSISVPTPIQSLTIPTILSGSDLICGSPTGTGKTLCFALPILQSLLRDPVGGHSLVLTPTRELALQLYEQFVALAGGAKRDSGVRVSLVLGGMDMMAQAADLARGRPHIIVGTPGRLWDILQSDGGARDAGGLLERCKFLVLDEADRLLTPTFAEALGGVMGVLPPPRRRQTLLFSATLTPEIEQLAAKRLAEAEADPEGREARPLKVEKIEFDARTPPNLRQRYVFVPSHVREVYLYHLLTHPVCDERSQRSRRRRHGSGSDNDEDEDEEEDVGQQLSDDDDESDSDSDSASSSAESDLTLDLDYSSDSSSGSSSSSPSSPPRARTPLTMIFTSRCSTAELLTRTLRELSLPALSLHSHLPQSLRLSNLLSFRRGSPSARILVCTDVAARGLDVPEVAQVVNFDLPLAWEDYVHRVGRTARAGREGWAVSFVGERDVSVLQGIEEKVGVRMKEVQMPEERVLQMLNRVAGAKRVAGMEIADGGFGERQRRNKEKDRKRGKGSGGGSTGSKKRRTDTAASAAS